MEDNQIVDLYWCRDEDAIQETGRKYTQFCFGIAWNILFNKEDSEECVNDTWLAAWKYIPPQRPVYFSAFLGKITRGFASVRVPEPPFCISISVTISIYQ